jgi:micrococcal nuclease
MSLYTYKAKYIKNYDGDTITFLVDLGFKISFEIRVRLLGIDTPEMRSRLITEREKAQEAKQLVESELSNAKEIFIHTKKDRKGKYGRYLAIVSYSDVEGRTTDLSVLLKSKNLAKDYEK